MDQTMRRELARQIAGLSEPSPRGDELFVRALERVGAFRAANGRRPEPMAEDVEEARLGRWLEAQRGDIRRGKLSVNQLSLLTEVLGTDWAGMAQS